jgi:hypothetical protein
VVQNRGAGHYFLYSELASCVEQISLFKKVISGAKGEV